MIKIDLHSHTHFSDGALSPEELVLRASNFQVDMLAITDHDTIEALEHAHNAIEKHNLKLSLVDGVEISTSWQGLEIHVLGLNVDRKCSTLKERLQQQLVTRENRAERIAHKLENCGVAGALEGAKQLANGQSVGRVHFARYLINNGYVDSFDKAFKVYLAKNAKAYVSPGWITIEDAINWIKEAGGQAVLAHPTRYDLTNKWVRKLVNYFADCGGDAIEVSMGRQSPNERLQLKEYANNHGLKASAGADFHRLGPHIELGKNIQLPEGVIPVWNDWPAFTALNT